jgi:hypothetical protein
MNGRKKMLQLIVYNKDVKQWEILDFSQDETKLIASFNNYSEACEYYDIMFNKEIVWN